MDGLKLKNKKIIAERATFIKGLNGLKLENGKAVKQNAVLQKELDDLKSEHEKIVEERVTLKQDLDGLQLKYDQMVRFLNQTHSSTTRFMLDSGTMPITSNFASWRSVPNSSEAI